MRPARRNGDGDEQEVERDYGRKMKKRRRRATSTGELGGKKSVQKKVDGVDVAGVKASR